MYRLTCISVIKVNRRKKSHQINKLNGILRSSKAEYKTNPTNSKSPNNMETTGMRGVNPVSPNFEDRTSNLSQIYLISPNNTEVVCERFSNTKNPFENDCDASPPISPSAAKNDIRASGTLVAIREDSTEEIDRKIILIEIENRVVPLLKVEKNRKSFGVLRKDLKNKPKLYRKSLGTDEKKPKMKENSESKSEIEKESKENDRRSSEDKKEENTRDSRSEKTSSEGTMKIEIKKEEIKKKEINAKTENTVDGNLTEIKEETNVFEVEKDEISTVETKEKEMVNLTEQNKEKEIELNKSEKLFEIADNREIDTTKEFSNINKNIEHSTEIINDEKNLGNENHSITLLAAKEKKVDFNIKHERRDKLLLLSFKKEKG